MAVIVDEIIAQGRAVFVFNSDNEWHLSVPVHDPEEQMVAPLAVDLEIGAR